jgi:hypothetical protein
MKQRKRRQEKTLQNKTRQKSYKQIPADNTMKSKTS